ncbi:MAG TPA: RDD family protein [Polyangiaceae bacterium]
MGEGPAHNPFAPPTEEADVALAGARYETLGLATYGQRFLGAFLDNLLYTAAAIPGFIAFMAIAWDTLETSESDDLPASVVLVFVGPLLLAAYQWNMVAKTGQSLAKRWLKTRIVRAESGTAPGFVNGVLLRTWLFGAAGAVPFVGSCIGLADSLAIFAGERRQTLHDRVAGTIVIAE